MSVPCMTRKTQTTPVSVATAVENSTTVRFADLADAVVHVHGVPSSAVTTFQVFGSHDGGSFVRLDNGTVRLVRDFNVVVVGDGTTTITEKVYTTMGGAYSLPRAVFALPMFRLVADADIGTNATATVSMKS